MYPQGVCRIRKPAYAGNGCAIFLVFQTEEVGQKDGCGSQTQLRGVALIFRPITYFPFSCKYFFWSNTRDMRFKGEEIMKATGIVRRVDDLGRIVIPKEIRRTLRIREGDPLQTSLTRWEKFCFSMLDLAKRRGW